jgi:hypothetical protein
MYMKNIFSKFECIGVKCEFIIENQKNTTKIKNIW